MAGVKGRSGKPKDKPFAEALRMELSAAGDDHKALRRIAARVIAMAEAGDMQAINAIADRLDGKPAQEAMVTIDDKRDSTDWTRAELVEFLNNARTRSNGAAKANGRGGEPDQLH